MGARQIRVPLEPLLVLLRALVDPTEYATHTDAIHTWRDLADYIDIDRVNFYRWRAEGGIPLFTADRIALRLGYHPSLIWPNWYELEHEDADRRQPASVA